MFHQHIFVVLLTVTCVETLFIERKLYGDVITNISKDECKISENTEWKKKVCTCETGYETAIVVENKVKCKNRSEILKLFDSSRCTIFGHNTDKTRIVVARYDGVFFLNNRQRKVKSCPKRHGTKIDLLYPQKQVISINWTFHSLGAHPYVKFKSIDHKYSGYLFRINGVCNEICIVAKFNETVLINTKTTTKTTTTTTTTTTALKTTKNSTFVTDKHNSSSIDIPLLVGIVIAALILILVVLSILFAIRQCKRPKIKEKKNPQPSVMGNPEYDYVISTAAKSLISSDTIHQTATYSPMYDIPKTKERPQKDQPEPVYFETEPEYDDTIYAQEKLEEYLAAKRPVYAKINKNR
ncbi:uncharacterized protein LOC130649357 [Hydractinia symbiolongicarpus]|uniref:uncharacterized protein LOC130649357 n=1 Tax=Hydractinia symbiolongicarpus TaxID=13093 RepID=UPI00254D8D69|nr:uncharacterized protein LOC130649357 [Hydractinia symbiolongicarpus]